MATRNRKADRKKHWFEMGAQALAKLQPGLPYGYGCPICARVMPKLEYLSFEHVPPKDVGGKPLVLTCTECNSRSGHDVDHAIRAGIEAREILAGRKPARGTFTQDGLTINAEMLLGDKPEISILRGNDPRKVEAHIRQMDGYVESKVIPPEFTLAFSVRHDKWAEEVAWLRVGFLYAFALFGYRYSMLESLGPVRAQIRRPKEKLTPGLARRVSPGPPKSIAFVREPSSLRGVMVALGEWLVFLPGLINDETFYQRMAAPPSPGLRLSARTTFELPRRPVFCFDLDDTALPKIFRWEAAP